MKKTLPRKEGVEEVEYLPIRLRGEKKGSRIFGPLLNKLVIACKTHLFGSDECDSLSSLLVLIK